MYQTCSGHLVCMFVTQKLSTCGRLNLTGRICVLCPCSPFWVSWFWSDLPDFAIKHLFFFFWCVNYWIRLVQCTFMTRLVHLTRGSVVQVPGNSLFSFLFLTSKMPRLCIVLETNHITPYSISLLCERLIVSSYVLFCYQTLFVWSSSVTQILRLSYFDVNIVLFFLKMLLTHWQSCVQCLPMCLTLHIDIVVWDWHKH